MELGTGGPSHVNIISPVSKHSFFFGHKFFIFVRCMLCCHQFVNLVALPKGKQKIASAKYKDKAEVDLLDLTLEPFTNHGNGISISIDFSIRDTLLHQVMFRIVFHHSTDGQDSDVWSMPKPSSAYNGPFTVAFSEDTTEVALLYTLYQPAQPDHRRR